MPEARKTFLTRGRLSRALIELTIAMVSILTAAVAWGALGPLIGGIVLLVAFALASFLAPKRHKTACTLGADGLEVRGRFIAWSEIESVRRFERDLMLVLEDGGRVIVAPEAQEALHREIRTFLSPPTEHPVPEVGDYRSVDRSPRVLVRVVQDSAQELARRADALAQLPPEMQEEVLESLADSEARDRLADS